MKKYLDDSIPVPALLINGMFYRAVLKSDELTGLKWYELESAGASNDVSEKAAWFAVDIIHCADTWGRLPWSEQDAPSVYADVKEACVFFDKLNNNKDLVNTWIRGL